MLVLMHYLQNFHETDDFESEDSCKWLFINVPHYQRKLQFLRFFQEIVENTQHKNEHLASTKRSFHEILYECLKNRPHDPPSKKRVKRIFIRKEKTRERINFHKVLFFYSQNGRPDEKEEKQERTEAAILM